MNKIFRVIVGLACLFMLAGAVSSCITVQAPTITTEEKFLVEKILARRVGYEVTKKYDWLAQELLVSSNKAVEVLTGVSTDTEINDAISEFVATLTGKYLTADPMLQRDVMDLAEILMPTVSIETGETPVILDENLKAELINIFKSFNEGVEIAIMQSSK